MNAADTAFCNLTNSTLNSNDFDEFYTDIKQLAWVDNHDENIKLLDSLINQKKYLTNTQSFPKSKIKEELSTIQKLTKGDNLVTVVKNIFSYDTEDEWYAKGKQTIKNGSPTSAHLIWLQCQNSPKLNLKEVFLFELNLAIQITRQGDFKEGVRALIIDKDNTPDWKFDSIENVSQDWVKEHIKLAWESNPLEDL